MSTPLTAKQVTWQDYLALCSVERGLKVTLSSGTTVSLQPEWSLWHTILGGTVGHKAVRMVSRADSTYSTFEQAPNPVAIALDDIAMIES